MLSAEQLKNLDTFLNLGIAFFILFFILLLTTCILLIVYGSICEREASKEQNKDELEELEQKLTLEIRKAKDKELSAKDCALMNIESDIKYIREHIKEDKK